MYEGDDHDDPVAVVEKEVRIKKPFTFKFSDLKPDTKYTAMVNGICKYNVIHRTARYNHYPQLTGYPYQPHQSLTTSPGRFHLTSPQRSAILAFLVNKMTPANFFPTLSTYIISTNHKH